MHFPLIDILKVFPILRGQQTKFLHWVIVGCQCYQISWQFQSGHTENQLSPNVRIFLEVNTKSIQIHIVEIMFPHEFMGKNLCYTNSANSSSKSEVTLF